MQLEVHVEHVDQCLADRAAPRRVGLLLEKSLDVLAHVVGFQLFVVRPFGGDAVELELGIRQGDVGIESRGGSGDKIAWYVVERGDARGVRIRTSLG